MRFRFAVVALVGCATAQSPLTPTEPRRVGVRETSEPSRVEEVLSIGGEAFAIPPPATIELTPTEVIVWSMTEVPGDSRLQAALAMVDALARAELQKSIAVGVASVELDVQRGDEQHVARMTAEVARGVLPGLEPPRHAWQKVRREGETVLRLVARLRAGRVELERAIAGALSDNAALARQAVERMAP